MKRFFKWFGIAFCAFIALIVMIAFLGIGKTERIVIENIDLQQVPNGTYVGTYNGFRFTNTVEVTVENHAIVNIDVVKTQRPELSETLKSEVIAAQSPKIDTVSGATLDQNAFLKAVENALTQAIAGAAQE
ncbi:MAG: FMN-binding protein [Eubacteriales bacterium]|jgi:uncharacterized protein with FMN-binding domain|nr:FMN-binding protein [Eubacteriales bacterium]